MRAVASQHAHRRLADLPSCTPSGGGPRADPVQKHDPASGQRLRGIGSRLAQSEGGTLDKARPVTEARMKCGDQSTRELLLERKRREQLASPVRDQHLLLELDALASALLAHVALD